MERSIQQALEDYRELQRDIQVLRESERQLKDMNVGLMLENELLKDRAESAEKERDQAKVYAYELVARLDVISETITSAKAHSRNMALRDGNVSENAAEVVDQTSDHPEHGGHFGQFERDLGAMVARIPLRRPA